MQFLALVQRLVSELGIELPAKITTVDVDPVATYGTTTEMIHKCVDWVSQAWVDIQEDNADWLFMRKEGIFDLVAGQAEYDITLQTDLSDYDDVIPFVAPAQGRYVWLTDGSVTPMLRTPCYYVPPELFFGYHDRRVPASGKPTRYTFNADGSILFDPPPSSDSYKAEFLYRRSVQELTDDTDTPTDFPSKYHMLIVYTAMGYYSGFDESDPQTGRAFRLQRRMMHKLRLKQLPEYMAVGVR